MKFFTALFLITMMPWVARSQQEILGTVLDEMGQPVTGANVYLLDTYDGTSTGANGDFNFESTRTGKQVLVVSMIGFISWQQEIQMEDHSDTLRIRLNEEVRELDDLVISAGLFEAGDEKKSVALRPLDIVTTAGATADIPGVLNTMPGTQTVGEQGRLFVRGGEGEETRNFIDGMYVADAYGLSPRNIPSRMRFSPFLFSGTSFSTGGYSAEYGQALSGTLVLKTDDEAIQTQTDLSLMSVGGGIAHTQKWDNSSVFLETSYTNLTPYFSLVPQNSQWSDAPVSWQNTLMYRRKTNDRTILKVFYTNDFSSMSLDQPSPLDVTEPVSVSLRNNYHYAETNYESFLNDNWQVYGGLSGSFSGNNTGLDVISDKERESYLHAKSWLRYEWGSQAGIKFGMDTYYMKYGNETIMQEDSHSIRNNFHEWLPGLFAESDLYITNKLIGRIGLRGEYSSLADQFTLSPRLSLAFKTGKFSQVSFASGIFRQRPSVEYRMADQHLGDEMALHYILNYQWVKELRTFRVECYLKKYLDLVTFDSGAGSVPDSFENSGYGYARGVDLFWRDSETFRNVDYWISYSWLDTKRMYRDYPVISTPSFASAHNLSVVYKHFIAKLKSQAGATFSWSSGRRYNDPNSDIFNSGVTPSYVDLSLNYSYLLKTNFIIHFSITNVLGSERTFGYQYSLVPDESGVYEGVKIGQPAKRFIFLGIFWTLSRNGKANQLRNL